MALLLIAFSLVKRKTYHLTYSRVQFSGGSAEIDAYHESKHDGKTFAIFRRVLKNPSEAAAEFGIDPKRADQAFAARIFMKVVIRNLPIRRNFNQMLTRYNEKLTAVRKGRAIPSDVGAKNLLLMQNDPVQKLPTSQAPSALDIILANTHFETPKATQTLTVRSREGAVCRETKEYGPTREEARAMIKGEFVRIWNHPELRHVLEALAVLIQKEKGHILISKSNTSTGSLGASYTGSGAAAATGGFYQNNHTIFLSSLINPFVSDVTSHQISTFVHEALHFLFNKIVQNNSSPVTQNSAEEKALDEALKKDRDLREAMNPRALSVKQESVWRALVTDLEREDTYFPGGFNPENAEHLRVMRVEAIVRIMQEIAAGVSIEDIKKIAPNLCDFYYRYSKPLLLRYAREATAAPLPGPSSSKEAAAPVAPLPGPSSSKEAAAPIVPLPGPSSSKEAAAPVAPQPREEPKPLSFFERLCAKFSWFFSFAWIKRFFTT